MSFLERLGYVTIGRYAEVLKERDTLRRRVSVLEDTIEVLEAEKNWLMSRVEFLKMVVPSVRKIRNIGPRTAQKLETIGIKNIIDLIETSPEKIAKGTGLSEERIQRIVNKATKLIKKQTW